MRTMYQIFSLFAAFATISEAQTRIPCGSGNTWCYFIDIYPSQTEFVSEQVVIRHGSGDQAKFEVSFTATGAKCRSPHISFNFELIDYDSPEEYLDVLDNYNALIQRCQGGQERACPLRSECLTDYDLGIPQIEQDELYTITVSKSDEVDALCFVDGKTTVEETVNATLIFTCAPIITLSPTPAPTITPKTSCGTNKYCYDIDMYPLPGIQTAETIVIADINSDFDMIFEIRININNGHCIDPSITFSFEEIDYVQPGEYIDIFDNDGTLIKNCSGTVDYNCGHWVECLNNSNVAAKQINSGDTYTITVVEAAAVDALCFATHPYSINALFTFACSANTAAPTKQPTMDPTKVPTASPTLPTTYTTLYPSQSPTMITYNPTNDPLPSPTTAPSSSPSTTPTFDDLVVPNQPTMPVMNNTFHGKTNNTVTNDTADSGENRSSGTNSSETNYILIATASLFIFIFCVVGIVACWCIRVIYVKKKQKWMSHATAVVNDVKVAPTTQLGVEMHDMERIQSASSLSKMIEAENIININITQVDDDDDAYDADDILLTIPSLPQMPATIPSLPNELIMAGTLDGNLPSLPKEMDDNYLELGGVVDIIVEKQKTTALLHEQQTENNQIATEVTERSEPQLFAEGDDIEKKSLQHGSLQTVSAQYIESYVYESYESSIEANHTTATTIGGGGNDV